jgi:hypothetical protein
MVINYVAKSCTYVAKFIFICFLGCENLLPGIILDEWKRFLTAQLFGMFAWWAAEFLSETSAELAGTGESDPLRNFRYCSFFLFDHL